MTDGFEGLFPPTPGEVVNGRASPVYEPERRWPRYAPLRVKRAQRCDRCLFQIQAGERTAAPEQATTEREDADSILQLCYEHAQEAKVRDAERARDAAAQ